MKHSVREVTLDNGLKGLFIDVPAASVMYVEVNVRAGEYLVDRDKWETAHLMEHVLLGANERHKTAVAFQTEIEKNGAYSNASTGVYDITYEAEFADFEWARVLEELLVAIAKPLFLEDEFVSETSNVREELTSRSNNHFRHLSISLRERMGLVAMTDQKRLELMKHVTLEDIARHYKRTHTITNTRFIIAGNLKGRHRKIAELFCGHLRLPVGKKRFALPKETPLILDDPLVIRRESVPNMYFYIDAFVPYSLQADQKDALSVTTTLLTETYYSRIFGKARVLGLVYALASGHGSLLSGHNVWLGAQVSHTNAPRLFRLIRDECSAIANGLLEQTEVRAAAQYLIGRYMRADQTVGSIVQGYSDSYFIHEEIEDYGSYESRMRAVTRNQVEESLQAFFAANIWGVGMLGNVRKAEAREYTAIVADLWKSS
jgi:predicted Zn-dependent peptidase